MLLHSLHQFDIWFIYIAKRVKSLCQKDVDRYLDIMDFDRIWLDGDCVLNSLMIECHMTLYEGLC